MALGLAVVIFANVSNAKELKLDDLFPNNRLINVNITISDQDWDKIRYQRRTRENALPPSRKFQPPPSPYSYVKADVVIEDVSFKNVGIRKKGFLGSQDTERPSLKVKLDYYEKNRNIDGLKNLTFNNNRQDQSLMSQFMGYRIWDEADSPGSRCAYAKITVNGRNLGVYCHVETVNRKEGKISVSLFSEGKMLIQKSQKLRIGSYMVLAGKSTGDSAWFIVISKSN